MIHGISLVIALLIVVFLHMVIGEMAPKNITISAPERTAVLSPSRSAASSSSSDP